MKWLDDITNTMEMTLGKLWEMVKDREACMMQSMGSQRVGHDWLTEQQEEEENSRKISKLCHRKK